MLLYHGQEKNNPKIGKVHNEFTLSSQFFGIILQENIYKIKRVSARVSSRKRVFDQQRSLIKQKKWAC